MAVQPLRARSGFAVIRLHSTKAAEPGKQGE
jgi:hypothetical protein